jgi:cytidyltransferase-like protein
MPRIYCNGVFDLCHIGHIKQFEQASKYGQVVVGVHSDEDVATYKRVPIQTTEERVEIVKNSKYVDQVISNAPLITTLEFMKANQLDFILISPEYDSLTDHYYAEPRIAGKVIVGSRYPNMSTSLIVSRIKSRNDL